MSFRTSRRSLLGGLALGLTLPGLARAQLRFTAYPFSLGVAAADPSPDGFVL